MTDVRGGAGGLGRTTVLPEEESRVRGATYDARAGVGPAGRGGLRPGDLSRYVGVHLPLTAALIRAGLGGLSMSTPGHRGGRLFGAWEALGDDERR